MARKGKTIPSSIRSDPPLLEPVPNVVRFMGKSYKVLVDDAEIDESDYGEYSHGEGVVRINGEAQWAHETMDTLLHEFIHAIDENMQIGLKEKQVARLGTGLLALLRDNPSLVKYLTQT
jgi:hypothetical protein